MISHPSVVVPITIGKMLDDDCEKIPELNRYLSNIAELSNMSVGETLKAMEREIQEYLSTHPDAGSPADSIERFGVTAEADYYFTLYHIFLVSPPIKLISQEEVDRIKTQALAKTEDFLLRQKFYGDPTMERILIEIKKKWN